MQKVPGVQKVEVTLNQGKAVLQLKPGNVVHLDELVQKVRDNAFTPKEARVRVRGELVSAGGKLQLKVIGVNDLYDLAPAPELKTELAKNVGKTVLVEGVVPAPKDKTPVRTLDVKSYKLSS